MKSLFWYRSTWRKWWSTVSWVSHLLDLEHSDTALIARDCLKSLYVMRMRESLRRANLFRHVRPNWSYWPLIRPVKGRIGT